MKLRHGGFGMVEVLVALLVTMIGLLGMAGLQGRALTVQMEAYQRAQAIVIAKDMVARINANRGNASSYATVAPLGTAHNDSAVLDCTGLVGQALDACAWHNLLLGAMETESGANVGAMIGARGCVTYSAGPPEQLLVSVAWQGLTPSAVATVACGAGEYGDEELRRVISIPITIANLEP
ncbi:MAG: type IV pilus modification protein PilV [Thiohalomonadaceae bacterium]